MPRYRAASRAWRDIAQSFGCVVQKKSIDEALFDLTPLVRQRLLELVAPLPASAALACAALRRARWDEAMARVAASPQLAVEEKGSLEVAFAISRSTDPLSTRRRHEAEIASAAKAVYVTGSSVAGAAANAAANAAAAAAAAEAATLAEAKRAGANSSSSGVAAGGGLYSRRMAAAPAGSGADTAAAATTTSASASAAVGAPVPAPEPSIVMARPVNMKSASAIVAAGAAAAAAAAAAASAPPGPDVAAAAARLTDKGYLMGLELSSKDADTYLALSALSREDRLKAVHAAHPTDVCRAAVAAAVAATPVAVTAADSEAAGAAAADCSAENAAIAPVSGPVFLSSRPLVGTVCARSCVGDSAVGAADGSTPPPPPPREWGRYLGLASSLLFQSDGSVPIHGCGQSSDVFAVGNVIAASNLPGCDTFPCAITADKAANAAAAAAKLAAEPPQARSPGSTTSFPLPTAGDMLRAATCARCGRFSYLSPAAVAAAVAAADSDVGVAARAEEQKLLRQDSGGSDALGMWRRADAPLGLGTVDIVFKQPFATADVSSNTDAHATVVRSQDIDCTATVRRISSAALHAQAPPNHDLVCLCSAAAAAGAPAVQGGSAGARAGAIAAAPDASAQALHAFLLCIGSQIAYRIRLHFYLALGFTTSAAVAANPMLAKMVSAGFKPNQQSVLLPQATQAFLATCALAEVPQFGPKRQARGEAYGFTMVRLVLRFLHSVIPFSRVLFQLYLLVSCCFFRSAMYKASLRRLLWRASSKHRLSLRAASLSGLPTTTTTMAPAMTTTMTTTTTKRVKLSRVSSEARSRAPVRPACRLNQPQSSRRPCTQSHKATTTPQ
jgi:hypothetical protein